MMVHSTVKGTPAFMAPELFKLGGGDDLNDDLPASSTSADAAQAMHVELEAHSTEEAEQEEDEGSVNYKDSAGFAKHMKSQVIGHM